MRMLGSILGWTILLAFFIAAIGCGGSNRAAVAGRVSLDDKVIDGGSICFIPIGENHGPAAWGEIKAGDYSISAKTGPAIGANRVEIRWTRKTGRILRPARGPNLAEEEFKDFIPARYNSRSELKTELKPGQNQADFELKSK